MRKAMTAGGAVFGLLLALWIVAGAVVWSRNSYSAPALPARPPAPPNNAYPIYTAAVRGVQSTQVVSSLFGDASASPSAVEKVVASNASVLHSIHAAAAQPSVVTELEPKEDFVAAIDFPNVTKLLLLDARLRTRKAPATAVDPVLDGVRFSEGVMRGGAMLHLLTGYLAYAPLFEGFPTIVRSLPAEACASGADGLKRILSDEASLEELVRNEHAVRFRQLTSTFPAPGRIFRFDIPWDDAKREFTMKPKAPAVEGLNKYFDAWQAEAKKPIGQVTPPPGPTGMEGILNDDSMGPEEMGKRFLQFYWRDARLRLVYTALRLEQHRKQKGTYPAELKALGSDPLFIDPFSGNPLVYRRGSGDYALYSVGPNGKDDGGISLNEARLSPDKEGDLPLAPTFGRR